MAAVPAVCTARGRPYRPLFFLIRAVDTDATSANSLPSPHKPPRERRAEPRGDFFWAALIGSRNKLKILFLTLLLLLEKLGGALNRQQELVSISSCTESLPHHRSIPSEHCESSAQPAMGMRARLRPCHGLLGRQYNEGIVGKVW